MSKLILLGLLLLLAGCTTLGENMNKQHTHIADGLHGFLQINQYGPSENKEGWYDKCKICGKLFTKEQVLYSDTRKDKP